MIKNSKSISVYTFAFVLMLILSLMIGTTVWAKKPADKPGKSDKSVKTWDLTICIGTGYLKDPEDIVLDEPDYLLAEDVPCSGGLWNLPSETGPPRQRGWAFGSLYLYKSPVADVGWVGDECGTYQLVTPLDDYYDQSDDLTVEVGIQHQITPPREGYPDGEDYWEFSLKWVDGPEPSPVEYTRYTLRAQTDMDPDPEGELSDTTGWLVEFIQAEAILYVYEYPPVGEPPAPPNTLWEGTVSFTVEIARTPHEP